MDKNIQKLFNNKKCNIPIWFLRQSGRHIPEYFSIRSKAKNFVDFCLNKELIVESTKLPLKYYDLDAAIIFSDILMIPWAMKRDLHFVKEQGPILKPMLPGETIIENKVDINEMNPSPYLVINTGNPTDAASAMVPGPALETNVSAATM